MADPFHERFETNRGEESQTRERFESADPLEYPLIESDFLSWPGFLYHSLADTFYSDPDLWWIIADANPIRRAKEWKIGDIVLIPKDYRQAPIQNADEAALRRKIY